MWQGMTLRTRLNVLFGGLLALGLLASIGWILLTAGSRVRAEDESSVRLARELIETAVASLKTTPEPAVALEHLVEGLNNLRHVAISVEKGDPAEAVRAAAQRPVDEPQASVPAWFVALVQPARTIMAIPVVADGAHFGTIVIASNPWDESEEVWGSLVSLALGGVALALVVFGVNSWIVARALAPIGNLGEAMTTLESGRYSISVPLSGAPELVDICRKLNSLGGTLGQTTQDNRYLSEMLVTLQDKERRELARELHDEFGPYLFAIRAGVSSLQRGFDKRGDQPESRNLCLALQEQVDALQQINRRVLERLRPAAMAELGLQAALLALVAMWAETDPDVSVQMEVPDDLDDLDDTMSLTVYRIVQEGLTNVFRHAGASEVRVKVVREFEMSTGRSAGGLRLRIADNGVGLSTDNSQGFGLLGMRERVWALQGKMTIGNGPEGGVEIDVRFPEMHGGHASDAGEARRETFPV